MQNQVLCVFYIFWNRKPSQDDRCKFRGTLDLTAFLFGRAQVGRGTLDRKISNLTKKTFPSHFYLYMILKRIKKLFFEIGEKIKSGICFIKSILILILRFPKKEENL